MTFLSRSHMTIQQWYVHSRFPFSSTSSQNHSTQIPTHRNPLIITSLCLSSQFVHTSDSKLDYPLLKHQFLSPTIHNHVMAYKSPNTSILNTKTISFLSRYQKHSVHPVHPWLPPKSKYTPQQHNSKIRFPRISTAHPLT